MRSSVTVRAGLDQYFWMLNMCPPIKKLQQGFSLIEVLITMVILAFGLLGMAGMQAKVQSSETDSFQRAQALLLVQDMANRLSANRTQAAAYLTGSTPLGTGDTQPASCTGLVGVALDQCEWSRQLKGAAEKASSASTANSVGAMVDARGCIDLVAGAVPPTYAVTVAWQGLSPLGTPTQTCGSGSYGADTFRRALTHLVVVSDLTAP